MIRCNNATIETFKNVKCTLKFITGYKVLYSINVACTLNKPIAYTRCLPMLNYTLNNINFNH